MDELRHPSMSPVHWSRWIWLLYLSFFFIAPVARNTPQAWLETAAALAVFLPTYGWQVLRASQASVGARVVGLVIAVALGIVTASHNPGANTFFIYAAAFVPTLGTIRRALVGLGLVSVFALATAVTLQGSLFFWIPAVVCTPLVGMLCIRQMTLEQAYEQIRQSRQEVAKLAQIAERERIARDLHDLLGHTLTVIVLKSELAAKLTDKDDPRAASEIREVERISRQTLQEVRAAVAGYRQHTLDMEVTNAERMLAAAGVELERDLRLADTDLTARHESALALALREAVTNVVRHSRASTCRILLQRQAEDIQLEVADDGIGTARAEGAGLSGMRERITGLGGLVERHCGDGTRLVVSMPLQLETPRLATALPPEANG